MQQSGEENSGTRRPGCRPAEVEAAETEGSTPVIGLGGGRRRLHGSAVRTRTPASPNLDLVCRRFVMPSQCTSRSGFVALQWTRELAFHDSRGRIARS